MRSTLLIPALVLLLGAAAIVAITGLQAQASDSAAAELKLARAQTALNALQIAPFKAARATGGSPKEARLLIDRGQRDINRSIAGLRRSAAPPPALLAISAPLRANYATLERIYTIGVADGDYGREADALAGVSARQAGQVAREIRHAEDAYQQRSTTADLRATIGSATVILLLVGGFGFLYRRSASARLTAERLVVENGQLLVTSRVEALTDALTGLPNRRALIRDLEEATAAATAGHEHVLAILDLDGFKLYNDTFGHPAGDALLSRLGARLAAAMRARGAAYRMGGDEFCIVAPAGPDGGPALVQIAAEALSEAGTAFDIGCSYGLVRIGKDVTTVEEALRRADQGLYDQKVGRSSSSRQTTDVLLSVLSERSPDLHHHLTDVAELAEAVSRGLGLSELDVQWIRIAAELHDVGKVAIPDAILNKPGPLTDDEWAFMRRHSVIGERIIRSAPSLAPAAKIVRSSHERYDGKGYPDGMRGEEIEVGASIIAVCDTYDAMVSDRVYRKSKSHEEALAELTRCAGTQFDPAIVELFCSIIERREDRFTHPRLQTASR